MVFYGTAAMGFRVFPQFGILCDIFAAIETEVLSTPFKRNNRCVVENNL